MHHSDRPLSAEDVDKIFGSTPERKELLDRIAAIKDTGAAPGATGRFPEGKLVDEDEGELRFRLGRRDDKVVVDFGKPVKWLGMSRQQAVEFGNLLIKVGTEAEFETE